MKRLLIIILILLIVIIGFTYLKPQPQTNGNVALNVVTSSYPYSEFAKKIGGNLVSVQSITPNGVEPHDYEPSPQDIKKILESDVFIINGNGLDSWAETILSDAMNNEVSFLRMSDHMNSLSANRGTGSPDPHFWIDPIRVEQIVNVIAQTYVITDPHNKDTYEKNAANYLTQIHALQDSYENNLKDCQRNEIIVSHNAFSYLGERYNIFFTAIAGLSPESEPSAQQLVELTEFIRSENIQYIFSETLVSPRITQTLASETNTQVLTLNPLEGLTQTEQRRGADYISIMTQNLENLKVGLECR